MRAKLICFTLALLGGVALCLPFHAEAAAGPRWELLGARNVTDRLDHDTIPVTKAEGTFRALQLRVIGRAVQFRDMKIHFANGDTQDVALRQVIPAGGESRVIDVEGHDRAIRSVEFWYDAQSRGRRATVRLYGKN